MWVLEWGITGALLTYLPVYFTENKLEFSQVGQLYAVSAIGLLVAPFVVGQICDRWMSSERYLAVAQIAGGIALISFPAATEHFRDQGEGFGTLLLLVGLYAVAYFPTIPLASSLTFRHLTDRDQQFGGIRIWGTVGWVVAGLALSFWLGQREATETLDDVLPDFMKFIDRDQLAMFGDPLPKHCFYLGAGLSFALAIFSFFLPATPPVTNESEQKTIAPIEVLRMFKNRTFSLLIGISFILAMVVPIYSLAVPKFVEKMLGAQNIGSDWVPAVMTVGQISEFSRPVVAAVLLAPIRDESHVCNRNAVVGCPIRAVRGFGHVVGGSAWDQLSRCVPRVSDHCDSVVRGRGLPGRPPGQRAESFRVCDDGDRNAGRICARRMVGRRLPLEGGCRCELRAVLQRSGCRDPGVADRVLAVVRLAG